MVETDGILLLNLMEVKLLGQTEVVEILGNVQDMEIVIMLDVFQ